MPLYNVIGLVFEAQLAWENDINREVDIKFAKQIWFESRDVAESYTLNEMH